MRFSSNYDPTLQAATTSVIYTSKASAYCDVGAANGKNSQTVMAIVHRTCRGRHRAEQRSGCMLSVF